MMNAPPRFGSLRVALHAVFALLIVGLPAAAALAGEQSPLMLVNPLLLSYSRFGHHLMQWLPNHDRYEAVEALVAEGPVRPVILVFFTEKEARKGSKRQFFYVNDPGLARTLASAASDREVRQADIKYDRTAGPAGPHFRFELATADGPVVWDFRSQGEPTPDHAPGLINSADAAHDLRSGILIFYLEQSAVSGPSTVLTVGRKQYPVMAWDEISQPPYFVAYRGVYSKGVDVGYIHAGQVQVKLLSGPPAWEPGAEWVYSYRRRGQEAEKRKVLLVSRDQDQVTFQAYPSTVVARLAKGAPEIESVRLTDGEGQLLLQFSPPLPCLGRVGEGAPGVGWSISMGSHADLMKGTMEVRKQEADVLLSLAPESPAWARRLKMEIVARVAEREYSLSAKTAFPTGQEAREAGEEAPREGSELEGGDPRQ